MRELLQYAHLFAPADNLHTAQRAPVAQGIEHCPPEAGAQVRFLSGALEINHLKIENSFPFILVLQRCTEDN